VLLPSPNSACSPVVVPSLADESKLYYKVFGSNLTADFGFSSRLHQNLYDTAGEIPYDSSANILSFVTQLHSARAQVVSQKSTASTTAGDYAWLLQVIYSLPSKCCISQTTSNKTL
jgi:hypothetical protein